jgi:hypothetical protein
MKLTTTDLRMVLIQYLSAPVAEKIIYDILCAARRRERASEFSWMFELEPPMEQQERSAQ